MRLMIGRMLSLAMLCLCATRCGGSGSPPSSPSPGGAEGRTITITPSGVSPKTLTVTQGTRVLFINNDNTRHNMTSDPHPEHDECPEINQVGTLNANQSRETGNMNTVRTCGFHDHDDPPPEGSRWTGSIIITR